MAEEAVGDSVIIPKGKHRSEGMAADLPEGVDYPEGVPQGRTTAANDDDVNSIEGGDGKSSQAVPGTV